MMRLYVAVLLAVAMTACREVDGPLPVGLEVRITGPDTAFPGATVRLAGVATDAATGALPDSALEWRVAGEPATRGPWRDVVVGLRGEVPVELVARGPGGDSARAVHTVQVPPPGSVLWRVGLGIGDNPHELAIGSSGSRLYLGSIFDAAALDAAPVFRWKMHRNSSQGGMPFAIGPDGRVYHAWTALRALTPDDSVIWEAGVQTGDIAVSAAGDLRVLASSPVNGLMAVNLAGSAVAIATGDYGQMAGLAVDEAGRTYVAHRFPRWLEVYDPVNALLRRVTLAFPAACGDPNDVVPLPGSRAFIRSWSPVGSTCLSLVDWAAGTVVWTYQPEFFILEMPAVAADGSALFAISTGVLVKLSPDGTEAWRAGSSSSCADDAYALPPALGSDGTVFLSAGGRVAAVSQTGDPVWDVDISPTDDPGWCWSPGPALTASGWLFVAGPGFSVAALAAGIGPDTTAIWGQHLADAQRTRRARVR